MRDGAQVGGLSLPCAGSHPLGCRPALSTKAAPYSTSYILPRPLLREKEGSSATRASKSLWVIASLAARPLRRYDHRRYEADRIPHCLTEKSLSQEEHTTCPTYAD